MLSASPRDTFCTHLPVASPWYILILATCQNVHAGCLFWFPRSARTGDYIVPSKNKEVIRAGWLQCLQTRLPRKSKVRWAWHVTIYHNWNWIVEWKDCLHRINHAFVSPAMRWHADFQNFCALTDCALQVWKQFGCGTEALTASIGQSESSCEWRSNICQPAYRASRVCSFPRWHIAGLNSQSWISLTYCWDWATEN